MEKPYSIYIVLILSQSHRSRCTRQVIMQEVCTGNNEEPIVVNRFGQVQVGKPVTLQRETARSL